MAGSFGYAREAFRGVAPDWRTRLLPPCARKHPTVVVASGTSCRHQVKDSPEKTQSIRHSAALTAQRLI